MTNSTDIAALVLAALGFLPVAALALLAIVRTVTTVARDGYRRAPAQRPQRWYQREDALQSSSRGLR